MIASETMPDAVLVTPTPSRNVARFMDSCETSFSSNICEIFKGSTDESKQEPMELQCATLLLSVADIVSKEISSEGVDWEDDIVVTRPLSLVDTENLYPRQVPRGCNTEPVPRTRTSIDLLNRIRAVSLDMCDNDACEDDSPELISSFSTEEEPVVISPVNSPVSRRIPRRTSKIRALILNKRSEMPTKKSVEEKGTLNGPVRTILRKKFSWKNYPEVRNTSCWIDESCASHGLTFVFRQLEAFLIANREEYLRHSALNYTVQQKLYNNKLTERLLEVAADHGYVFDDEAFSFVTVRDRIRCYFKSYVQSAKKRGVVIGYAARKAGLLTEGDLEKSAGKAGRIVMPS